jgi:hypothetical protein
VLFAPLVLISSSRCRLRPKKRQKKLDFAFGGFILKQSEV